jgi:hypothetical protein
MTFSTFFPVLRVNSTIPSHYRVKCENQTHFFDFVKIHHHFFGSLQCSLIVVFSYFNNKSDNGTCLLGMMWKSGDSHIEQALMAFTSWGPSFSCASLCPNLGSGLKCPLPPCSCSCSLPNGNPKPAVVAATQSLVLTLSEATNAMAVASESRTMVTCTASRTLPL